MIEGVVFFKGSKLYFFFNVVIFVDVLLNNDLMNELI